MESTGPTGMSEPSQIGVTGVSGMSEPVTETGPTGMSEPSTIGVTEPSPLGINEEQPQIPDVLTLEDLMNEQSIVLQKEAADKALLETIGVQRVEGLKPKLMEWIMNGCPSAYPIFSVNIQPPSKCSDGVTRNLPEYIQYCSGKTFEEHVDLLRPKLPDLSLSFANFGGVPTIVVSKA